MIHDINNGTSPEVRDESDVPQDAKVAQHGAALAPASSFAMIDFVEFIRQRDMVCHLNLQRLLAVPIFCDTVTDFWNGLISLGAAYRRIRNVLTKADYEVIMPGAELSLVSTIAPRAIALVGYCSMLQDGDPRRVTLDARLPSEDIFRKYVDPITGQPYPICDIRDVSYRSSIEGMDRQEYISHWSRAFPDSFRRLIEDKRILSRIASASYHGADYVTEILAFAASELPTDLPSIDQRLKIELIIYINLLRLQGLLLYHFDPKREFPDYFSTLPVRNMDSSQ